MKTAQTYKALAIHFFLLLQLIIYIFSSVERTISRGVRRASSVRHQELRARRAVRVVTR